MPSKNSRKIYVPQSYYHVYNRGVEKRIIFQDQEDYSVFLNLCKRYLSKKTVLDDKGREYENLYGAIDLVSFCLMSNHFHMLVYVHDDPMKMQRLLSGVCNAYAVYFNKKYNRVGHLFQGRYKASLIDSDAYLLHITRYIHRNPKDYKQWEPSSFQYYLGSKRADWVHPQRALSLFDGTIDYEKFVESYKKESIDDIADQLAN